MTTPTIGIGITTRNRADQVRETASRILAVTPPAPQTHLVVVDDASDDPWPMAGFRFEENVGIARAKNKCLELLADCDHIFLFDDDAYPLVEDWWRPYVESPEPHLMYVFEDLAGSRKLKDISRLYEDDQHTAWSSPRGVMLYIDAKKVLPVVGGMDPIYGKWGYEHGDWSNRIHHAGLTSWRYGDVAGSDALIHSMDQYEELDRGVPQPERVALARRNAQIHNTRRAEGYQAYVEYREGVPATTAPGDRDVVITHLYSSKPDPQRPTTQLEAGSLEPAAALIESVIGADMVLISDSEIEFDFYEPFEIVQSSWSTNVFFQRHLDSWRYLRDHPEIRYVWCVDATDVEMLHEPWDEMVPDVLYLGYEPKKLSDPWIRRNHPTPAVQAHLKRRPNDTMLNPGVIGGDRASVMSFLHDMVRYHFDAALDRFTGKIKTPEDLGDMGATQLVAFARRDRVVTGSRVVTEFRKNEVDHPTAFWRHK